MQIKNASDDHERTVRKTFSRVAHSKKTLVIIFVIIFLIGGSIGFGLGGFFGDSTSILLNGKNMLVALLKTTNWLPYQEEQFAEGIYYENIRIPVNYIKGFLSSPEKITIDIKNNDYQKLAYQRELSLANGSLVSLGDDFVPAQIHYQDQTFDVSLKLKGGYLTNHFAGDRWSFRIDIKGDHTLFGMQSFCIQDPLTRHYLSEWLYHKTLKKEGVLALRYFFIDVIINGKHQGVYAVEESFDKRLIENNNLREGPIFRIYRDGFVVADQVAQTAKNPEKTEQLKKAKQLVEAFFSGQLNAGEVFDINKFARYMAIADLLAGQHAAGEDNIRYYYNPVTSKIEPIGFDAHDSEIGVRITELSCDSLYTSVKEKLFNDLEFFEKYISELERVSNTSYLDVLFNETNDELQESLNAIFRNNAWYHFGSEKEAFYANQVFIKNRLNVTRAIYAGYSGMTGDGNIMLEVANVQQFPVEIIGVTYRDLPLFKTVKERYILRGKMPLDIIQYEQAEFVLPEGVNLSEVNVQDLTLKCRVLGHSVLRSEDVSAWAQLSDVLHVTDIVRQYSNVDEFEFLTVDNISAVISVMPGNWELKQNLVIPAGFTVSCDGGTVLDIKNNAKILSYSPFRFIGTEDNRIIVESSDFSGQGIILLNTERISIMENVVFQGLSAPSQAGWGVTGAVTFYESPVEIRNCRFSNNQAGDDMLNIVRSDFVVTNSTFEGTLFDAFDVDFGNGLISNTSYVNLGNDAMDFSGSNIEVKDCFIKNAGDKGISIGERSVVSITQVDVVGSLVGVASKDNSQVNIRDITISDSDYGFAVYQKKPEYGPSLMTVTNADMKNIDKLFLVGEDSVLLVDGRKITEITSDILELLYDLD